MTLTKTQRTEFRQFLEGALSGHLADEVECYLADAHAGAFTEEELDHPDLFETLLSEADLIEFVWLK